MLKNRDVSLVVVGFVMGLMAAVGGFTAYVRNYTAAGSDTITLRLAHGLDVSHPVHLGMVYMAERLTEKSDGAVKIHIIAGGVLGSERDNVEQLGRGALAMTKVSAAAMESFNPEMGVFSLPYVFRDYDHFWNVLDAPVGKQLLQLEGVAGMRGLCYYDAGSRNFYTTTRPILTPDDLRGQKIRVMESRTSMDMIRVLGGEPTPISWGELYTSLQQGVVDGAENNPPSFYSSRHYEVCKFFTMNHHTRIPDILLINEDTWNALPPEVQVWLQEAADESVLYQRQVWQDETERSLEQVQQHGVEVFYPDLTPFVARVQPLLRRYDGTPVGALIQQIQDIE